jgi:hypothetical protein
MTPEEWEEQYKKRVFAAEAAGWSKSDIDSGMSDWIEKNPKPIHEVKGGWRDWVSEVGGIVGGIGGGIVGGVLGGGVGAVPGAVAGATLLGGAGQALESKLKGEKQSAGKIVREAALSGVGELAGAGIARIGGKVVGKVGSKLSKSSMDVVKKAFKPTATMISKTPAFSSSDDFAKFFIQEGKNISDETISALQKSYDDIANNPSIKFNGDDVIDHLLKKATELESKAPQKFKGMAKQFIQEAENIQQSIGRGNIALSDVVKIRKQYDELVRNFAADDFTDVSNTMRRSLMDFINNSADKAGAKAADGSSLGELGKKLNKFYAARDIIEAGLAKRGNRGPFTLPNIAGGAIGGSLGGVPGAVAGYVIGSAGENPRIIAGVAKALGGLGKKFESQSLKEPTKKIIDIMGSLGQVTSQALGSIFEQFGSTTYSIPSNTSDVVFSQDGDDNNQPLITNEEMAMLYLMDIQETNGKNITKLKTVFDLLSPSGSNKKLSEGDKKFALAEQEASKALKILESGKATTGKIPAITSKFSEFFGTQDVNTTALKSQIATARTAARNALLGANMSDKELESYLDAVFSYSNEPAIIAQKLRSFIGSMKDYRTNISGPELPSSVSGVNFENY